MSGVFRRFQECGDLPAVRHGFTAVDDDRGAGVGDAAKSARPTAERKSDGCSQAIGCGVGYASGRTEGGLPRVKRYRF